MQRRNLSLNPLVRSRPSRIQNPILVTGGSVHIRTGPGKEYGSVMIAHAGDVLHGIDAGRLESHPAGRRSALDQPEGTARRRTLESHNDRPPCQETGVEGFLFFLWE